MECVLFLDIKSYYSYFSRYPYLGKQIQQNLNLVSKRNIKQFDKIINLKNCEIYIFSFFAFGTKKRTLANFQFSEVLTNLVLKRNLFNFLFLTSAIFVIYNLGNLDKGFKLLFLLQITWLGGGTHFSVKKQFIAKISPTKYTLRKKN